MLLGNDQVLAYLLSSSELCVASIIFIHLFSITNCFINGAQKIDLMHTMSCMHVLAVANVLFQLLIPKTKHFVL